MAESAFRLPEQLNITEGNISENFRKWRRHLEVYMEATGSLAEGKPSVSILLHCAGPHIIEIFDQFTWENADDKKDVTKVLDKLQAYCNPRTSEVIESHRFWSVDWLEHVPFDVFLTELRQRADQCNFNTEKERMIRDKIVFSCKGKLLEHLLKETELNLEKAIKVCRAHEQSTLHVKEIRDSGQGHHGSRIQKIKVASGKTKTDKQSTRKQQDKAATQRVTNFVKDCEFCGGHHEKNKLKCPAYGKTCNGCKGRNHFKKKCRKKIQSVSVESPDNSDNEHWLSAITSGPKHQVNAVMIVNGKEVKFQLDTAADVNTICEKFVCEQVRPTDIKLKMWNNTNLSPLGEANLDVVNPRTSETTKVQFVVVPNGLNCLLGLKTIQQMGLVTINNDLFVNNVVSNVDMSLGDLGEASLEVDPDVKPKTLPCRKIPLAIKDDVKKELDMLVQRGILVPVTEPTKWVSQMAVVHKRNGKLRLCIDPQALNQALMREHFRLSTLDDVLPELANAKIFSKLDVKEAYWHVRLDEQSSLLTTMITPFGRFRWARLPFGLKVSSEIFQRKLHEAIGDLNGVFSIADDLLVAGCGESDSNAKRDMDQKLSVLYQRCTERSIVLNEDKKEIGLTEINFHGHRITRAGVMMDNRKVQAILNLEAPENVSAAKRFCGIVQYMAKFLPDLSDLIEPIRALTRKGVTWKWSAECYDAFNTIKVKLTTAPILIYFDASKPVTVQVDSSQFALGAVLLQDGKPVEYASRRLTTSERNWAQIEKEALAILFGLERFDQYTYGRLVIVENDHKPLESILKKPLSSAPRRLQDILVRLGRYNFEFKFIKGTSLVIADALSRAGLSDDNDTRPRIMNVTSCTDIPDVRLDEIRCATSNDDDMQQLVSIILNGWPEKRSDMPKAIEQYFDFRDTLGYSEGLIVKGEAIIIPISLRDSMKTRLHKSHLAFDSMMRRAKDEIFWPNMSKEIKLLSDQCEICQASKPSNAREPLQQHAEGGPWEKIGTDLFEISGRQYLVSVDYYSNFIEVEYLTSTVSSNVITLFKKQFSRFGIPKVIVSDGGPQFTSREFRNFTENWGIHHETSSPHHPQSNGKAEAAVKSVKGLIKKCLQDRSDPFEALLELRNIPRQDTKLSPAEMLLGRKTRSFIPSLCHDSKASLRFDANLNRKRRRNAIKQSYDKKAHALPELNIGQNVMFQKLPKDTWRPAKVVEKIKDRSYSIQSSDGVYYRRNRVHLRPTKLNVKIYDNVPSKPVVECETTCEPSNTNVATEAPVNPSMPVPETSNVAQPNAVPDAPTIANSRPKRIIREPAYLKDYVRPH